MIKQESRIINQGPGNVLSHRQTSISQLPRTQFNRPLQIEQLRILRKRLPEYQHPERAFYIFGAEDATLGARVLDRCRDRVFVPTVRCMNLAATVNVVLYDRMAKQ